MKNDEQKYDTLIARIRNTTPRLSDPQRLTADIMTSVEKLSQPPKPSRALRSITWISSVAALFFMGLFLTEHSISTPTSVQHTATLNYISYSPTDKAHFVTSVKEKRETRERTKTFYKNMITKYQNL